MVQKIGKNQTKVIKVGKNSGKYDILKVEEKLISHIWNKTKVIIETNTRKRGLEAIRLNATNMHIKKWIEKIIIVRYWWKIMLKVPTGE